MMMWSGFSPRTQQGLDGRHEIVGDRAADTAIGELDDIVFRARGDAAASQNLAIDADIAEFVDDQGQTTALCLLEQMADERRLAGAEKTGDDRRRKSMRVGRRHPMLRFIMRGERTGAACATQQRPRHLLRDTPPEANGQRRR